MELDRPEEAVQTYQAATEVATDESRPWICLGDAQLAVGNLEEAGRCYGHAIALDSTDPDAFDGKARLAEARGDSAEEQAFRTRAEELVVADETPSMPNNALFTLESTDERDTTQGATGEFGLAATNPIPGDAAQYCARLRCPAGHPFWFRRRGSDGACADGHIVDQLELACFGREYQCGLYVDLYHPGCSTLTPSGLGLSSPEGLGDVHSRILFPWEIHVRAE
jgi:hypothetical protein